MCNLTYEKHPEIGHEIPPAQSYFLVDILDYTSIEFESGANILYQAILSNYKHSHILRDYIENKFLVLYQGQYFVVCDNLEFNAPFDINSNNPHNMLRIRQHLRDLDYPISFSSTLNEICRILDIPRDEKEVKRRICERLEMRFCSPNNSDVAHRPPRRPVYTRKLATDEIQHFSSMNSMARNFNLDSKQVQRYIENEVEFHFQHELYRAYYA